MSKLQPRSHAHPHEHANVPLDELTGRLRASSRKITGPRQAILDVLRQESHPLTNREIRKHLGEDECDLATIYRSMHLLVTMGLVRKYDFGDGVARFELVRGDGDDHHHHLICTTCAAVVEIEECFPTELEQKIASKSGFSKLTHKLEFFGVCPECQ